MTRRMADRRGRPRFEIVGILGGTAETVLGLTLRNVSYGGALVEASVPVPPYSEHHVTAVCDDGVAAPLKVRVNRVQRADAASGRGVYLLGLEFLTVSAHFRAQIDRWLSTGSGAVQIS